MPAFIEQEPAIICEPEPAINRQKLAIIRESKPGSKEFYDHKIHKILLMNSQPVLA